MTLENPDPIEQLAHRRLTLKPHRKTYQHRDIVCVFVISHGKRIDVLAVTEQGERIGNLANYLLTCPTAHIVATNNPAWLADYMYRKFGHLECFQMKLTETRNEDETGEIKAALSRFGFTNGRNAQHEGRRKALHSVWCSQDFPTSLFPSGHCSFDELLKACIDVREYCKENALPIPNRPKGIASDFMRDERFWPKERGRVPEFTNEELRRFLPGNHMEMRSEPRKVINVWSIDMRAAYHQAAQSVIIPDHTTIYARGYSKSWETSPIWFDSDSPEYRREISRPGLVIVEATSRPTRKGEWRPKRINYSNKKRIPLWTNEIPFCEEMGLSIHGVICAWTSTKADTGLTKYGAFAEPEANNADAYRRKWLKPTLHTLYGMFAARKKSIRIGHLRGSGKKLRFSLGFGHSLEMSAFETPARSHPVANVAILGTLQAEIRVRMMRLANELESKGHPVTHMHADGIHVHTNDLPLLPDNIWKIEEREELIYIDDASWIWNNGDCLPGRPEAERAKELRRYADMIRGGLYGFSKRFARI